MRKRRISFKKISIFIFVILIFFFVHSYFNKTGYADNSLNNFPKRSEVKDIIYNRVIVIGDSRMENILKRKNTIKIPINFRIIAKGGAYVLWFRDEAVPRLKEILDNKKSKYKYHVVINQGVNDLNLNDHKSPEYHSSTYTDIYEDLFKKYDDVNFYILSVNPIDEKVINYYWPQTRTEDDIIKFNDYTVRWITNSHFKNIKYCDSYNEMEFKMLDGLHYTKMTDQNILNYIVNRCVRY